VYQYLRTGQWPQEPKDYYFPRTGEFDENGKPKRASLPTYVKDVYAWGTQPLRTMANKASPLLNMVAEMVRNQDYYGTKIRNEDDPFVNQLLEEAKFVGKEALPFGVHNYIEQSKQGASTLTKAQNFIGITPAPKPLETTRAEQMASEIVHSRAPASGLTQEQADRQQLERDIMRKVRTGKPVGGQVREAVAQGKLTPRQALETLRDSKLTPLERNFKRLTVTEAFKVWDAATPAEQKQLKPLLVKKAGHAWKTLPPEQQPVVMQQLRGALAR
jgi:hypothetical protein